MRGSVINLDYCLRVHGLQRATRCNLGACAKERDCQARPRAIHGAITNDTHVRSHLNEIVH